MQKLVCIDPQMHSTESHAQIHHPGLLPGADFCDAGVEDAPEVAIEMADQGWHVFPLAELADNLKVQERPLIGRIFRVMTGGDVSEEHIDVSAHKHHGHSSSLKVRPAAGVPSYVSAPHQGHSGDPKVAALTRLPGFQYPDEIQLPIVPTKPGQSVSEGLHADDPARAAHEGHSHLSKVQPTTAEGLSMQDRSIHNAHAGHVPTSKVQPLHSPAPAAKHEGHSTMSKVQPYSAVTISSGTETTFGSTRTEHDRDSGDESRRPLAQQQRSTMDEYWGFHEQPRETRHAAEVNQAPQSESEGHVNDLIDDSYGAESDSLIPPQPHSSRPSLSVDYKKTAQWLRDLLKYPESYSSKLTELPEKTKTRDKPKPKDGNIRLFETGNEESVAPRALTRQSTAASNIDNKFKKAVSNLEHLLTEALDLANEVADREDDHSCVDNLHGSERDKQDVIRHALGDGDSLYSTEEESIYEQPLLGPNGAGADTEEASMIGRHSQLDVHSGNVPVPERFSSLPRNKVYASGDLLVISQLGSYDEARRSIRLPSSSTEKLDDGLTGVSISQPQPEDLRNLIAVQDFIHAFDHSSLRSRETPSDASEDTIHGSVRHAVDGAIPEPRSKHGTTVTIHAPPRICGRAANAWGFDGVSSDDIIDWNTQYNLVNEVNTAARGPPVDRRLPHSMTSPAAPEDMLPKQDRDTISRLQNEARGINLHNRSHVSLRASQGFSMDRSYPRQPVARDWSEARKRFVATVACVSTALIGVLIGIYAGLVPSIQYWVVDLHHYIIVGNVSFYFGLAIPTFFFWPLPLLHGRKPYILSSLVIAMPLLFPQAIAVSAVRDPDDARWRWALLFPRALMGLALGFASMNFHSILMDLFGASLMSGNPHQEVVDKFDVRRHGGGMGVWLGIWTWCFMGSLGVGFLIGACIIRYFNPSWGFYVSIVLIAVVLFLNVLCPEVRRSAYRRSVAEVRTGNRVSRRVGRGEVMMHRVKDGPTWWGEEVYHGVLLSLEMLRQPGFAIMALYTGWIYAQVVLIIVLLGALTSQIYYYTSPWVGLFVSFISIGTLIAVPFQKANILSRGRHHQPSSSENTLKESQVTWTSHFLRRAVFCIFLPLAGIAYTLVSTGPPMSVAVPTFFAGVIGVVSGLAMAECTGLIMETFDTSDLQPGMTGRPRGSTGPRHKRTNYSSFPRVTSGLAICHTLGFIFAAGATGIGGIAQRSLGQREATGVVAGILLILTLLLLAVLVRFRRVQIIPTSKTFEMEKWTEVRRENIRRRSSASQSHQPVPPLVDEEIWRPVIIGNPSSKTRRVNMLELGAMTRWTEIRRKNRLIDASADLAHLNRAALGEAAAAVEEATGWRVRHVHGAGHMARHGLSPATGAIIQGESAAGGSEAVAHGMVSEGPGRIPLTMTNADGALHQQQEDKQASAEQPGQHRQQRRQNLRRDSASLPEHGQMRGAGEGFTEITRQTVPEETDAEANDDAAGSEASGADAGGRAAAGGFRRRRM